MIVGIAFNLILIRCASINIYEETIHDEGDTLTAMIPIDFSNTVSAAGGPFSADDANPPVHIGHQDSWTVSNA